MTYENRYRQFEAEVLDLAAKARANQPQGLQVLEITDLPFVRDTTPEERETGMPARIFWDVTPCSDPISGAATGAYYAELAVEYMSRDKFRPLLAWAALDMARSNGDDRSIQIGFLSRFADFAMKGFTLDQFTTEKV